jgi:NAD(P)-dependent dehydrogenase (short-subunit alcohol dehydrogenase family)
MGEGGIINISSNHAFLTMSRHFPYNAVKADINGMTCAMALDSGPDISVNTVNPGWIAVMRTTDGMGDLKREQLRSNHPVVRNRRPEDVAGVVSSLAGDDAAFITGKSILVDGGRSAVMQDDTLPDYRARRE